MGHTQQALKLLIVEDCHDTACSTAQLVELDGHRARIAYCAEDALALAALEPPDVVLLDVRLPRINGDEVARCLRHLNSPKPPMIIAISGSTSESDRRKMEEAGCHLYLLKPVDPVVVIGILRRFQRATQTCEMDETPIDTYRFHRMLPTFA